MKAIKIAALVFPGLVSVMPAAAADLMIQRHGYAPRVYQERVVAAPAPVWNPYRPADILYTDINVYPGWHDSYAYCGTTLVRDVLPDGRVVIRRVYGC